MAEKKLIGVYLEEADKYNKHHPILKKEFCSLDATKKCPYLNRKECIRPLGGWLGSRCPYGSSSHSQGPTPRAKAYSRFITNAKNEVNAGPRMPSGLGKNYLEEIGDYIYFPYSHATMCKAVPFLRHTELLVGGSPFLLKKDFTPEVIITLSNFTPRAFMGGIIKDYQTTVVPLFLLHLKYLMPSHYKKAVKLDNSIKEKTKSLDSIKRIVATLTVIPKGVVEGYAVGSKSFKPILWDGKWLEITGEPKEFTLFKDYKGTDFRVRFKPEKEKTKVVIKDITLIKANIKKCARFIDKKSFED